MSVEEKRHCIEPDHPSLSIVQQCELIGLPRARDYRGSEMGQESAQSLPLMRLIDAEYTRHPFSGSRKIGAWLQR